MARAYYLLILILALPLAPWWLIGIAGFVALIIFRNFWEGIIYFFFYDLLFGLPTSGWFKTQFAFTIIFIVLFLLVEGYKDRLRFVRS